MDYCSSCHRHLNGALVCPGCGAYAPDIAPPAVEGRALPTTTETAVTATSQWFTASRTRHGSDLRGEAAGGDGTDEVPHTGSSDGLGAAPQGRAARRRQLARWKKNKRRAVVATAVALVGGGLTVAALDRPSTDRAEAATAPDDTNKDDAYKGVPEEPPALPTLPAPTQPDTSRSSRTPPVRPPAADLPREKSPAPARRTTRTVTRPDAAAPAQPTPAAPATSGPQSQTDSPNSPETDQGGTGRAAEQPPPAADGSDSGTSSGATQPSPSPSATSPSEICLLVVCIG
ncbi:SCO2400 family protein [Streptomyces vastus]|uniref:Zinc ribbon domain-containing protein n=1 Tax=Streptomyces vastus TaxID=285451 RepID=A0ABN3QQH1_9ACTN